MYSVSTGRLVFISRGGKEGWELFDPLLALPAWAGAVSEGFGCRRVPGSPLGAKPGGAGGVVWGSRVGRWGGRARHWMGDKWP